jgi:peroxiredoxin Q/BCP
MSLPQVGASALNFSLLNQNGETITLDSFPNQWIVLYFYPKDLTPGCTTEAIDFSAMSDEWSQNNCVVLGVSPDTCKKHCQFIEKKELKVTLLSDEDHSMIESWGAWQLKKFMGREFMGVVRSTWLISPDRKIVGLWSPVSVKGHAQSVLQLLQEQK